MAVPLVGLQSQKAVQSDRSASFNWIIQGQVSRGNTASVLQDIREMLPEELVHALYDAMPAARRAVTPKDAVSLMERTGDDRLLPGNPLSIEGELQIAGLSNLDGYDPFKPQPIELDTFNFHSEPCFAGQLRGSGYRLPVYFDEKAKAQVAYCHESPVELTGIVRWCPPYSPKGASSLQLALRVAAVWLT